jgi:Ca2+:H+ antiporter
MPHSETSPLLENGDGAHSHSSFFRRVQAAVKAEGEPSWTASYRWFWFGSWLNIVLVFVLLSFLSHYLHWDAALRFSFSFLAIIPLAKVCTLV